MCDSERDINIITLLPAHLWMSRCPALKCMIIDKGTHAEYLEKIAIKLKTGESGHRG